MPFVIKEPTYSMEENILFRGTCEVVNNLFGTNGLFHNQTVDIYSKVYGLFIYLIAGVSSSADANMATNIMCRYAKELEKGSGTKFAIKQMGVLNDSYGIIRSVTENGMKTTLDIRRLVIMQAEALLSGCDGAKSEENISFVSQNIEYFMGRYLNHKEFAENVLPVRSEMTNSYSGICVPEVITKTVNEASDSPYSKEILLIFMAVVFIIFGLFCIF